MNNINKKNTKESIKTGENFALSREERGRMRQTIVEYMEMKPMRAPIQKEKLGSNFAWFLSMRPAAVLAAVVLVSAGSFSVAAANALPGDILYSVKIGINEPLSGLFAVSKSAKTKWAMDIAGTRLKEAATLAADGRLSREMQKDIQINFEEHAQIAIDNIEKEVGDAPESGAENAARFEARLSEYGRILGEVGAAKDIETDALAFSIRAEQEHAAAVRLGAKRSARADIDADSSGVAAALLRDAAKKQLSASKKLAEDASGALAPGSAESIAAELETASATISVGEDLLEKDDVREASGAFREAIESAEKLDVFLKTSAAIHKRTGLLVGEPEQAQATSIPTRRADKQKRDATRDLKGINAQKAAPSLSGEAKPSAAIQSATGADNDSDNDRSYAEIETESNEEIQMGGSQESKTKLPSISPILPVSVPVSSLP